MKWHFRNSNVFILHRIVQSNGMIYLIGKWENSDNDDKGIHFIPLSDTQAMREILSDMIGHQIPYNWTDDTDKPCLYITQKVYETGEVEIFSIRSGELRILLQPCYTLCE